MKLIDRSRQNLIERKRLKIFVIACQVVEICISYKV